jgi:small-conductance mechanosensitive channel
MRTVVDYIAQNWSTIFIPIIVFLVSLIALFWLRKLTLDRFEKWSKKTNWSVGNAIIPSLRGPFSLLCLILSIYLGLEVSRIPDNWKILAGNGLWTLFVIAVTITLLNLSRGLIFFYGRKYIVPQRVIILARNVVSISILVVAFLVVLDFWGVPTSPMLLTIAIIFLILIFAFRDAVPNFFAGFQIAASQDIKSGDYIKMENGEGGYVISINWNETKLRALDGSTVLIPNSVMVRQKIINYGHPLKKARQPFYFNSSVHMADLTGIKARSLPELVGTWKKMPGEVVHYHTHHFLEEHQYLIPQLSNDLAKWVKDDLGNEVLAERLASVNTFEFRSLEALRDRLAGIIEEYISHDRYKREAMEGREFYFIKSVSVVLPTVYVAHDLREFVEALRKISLSSLYFHVFTSRLRLGSESNDFSFWLDQDMEEEELGQEIARIDPYTLTLEGLRSQLIQVIEKRIK